MNSNSAAATDTSAFALDDLCIDTLRFLCGRCGAEGQQRPPWAPARCGANGPCAVDPVPQAQSGQSPLVRPRSLRAFCGTRVDAAVQPAPRDGLRSVTGADQAVPPMGQSHARPPGARPHAGRRGHDGAPRTGLRQRRRHGDGGGASGCALQPRRLRDHRSLHLRDRERWRSDGGRRIGGRIARRPSRARQADLSLRRQSRHAVGGHRHHLQRGPCPALRGVRLAHAVGRRRQ